MIKRLVFHPVREYAESKRQCQIKSPVLRWMADLLNDKAQVCPAYVISEHLWLRLIAAERTMSTFFFTRDQAGQNSEVDIISPSAHALLASGRQ